MKNAGKTAIRKKRGKNCNPWKVQEKTVNAQKARKKLYAVESVEETVSDATLVGR